MLFLVYFAYLEQLFEKNLAENGKLPEKIEYKSYILIDFSKVSKDVHDLFNDISDLNYSFLRLQFIFQVQLYERESVIIFDEVQLHTLARQAIKQLVKDHSYDYIETGSLISVRSKSNDIIIPSEETKESIYPIDYEEFRFLTPIIL